VDSADTTCKAVPSLTVTVLIGIDPSKNVTLPVAGAGDTIALSVTSCPKVDGFGEAFRLVLVTTGFTVWISGDEAELR